MSHLRSWPLSLVCSLVLLAALVPGAPPSKAPRAAEERTSTTEEVSPPLPAKGEARARVGRNSVIPLAFERNDGQADPRVSFIAHGRGLTALFGARDTELRLMPPSAGRAPASLRLRFEGSMSPRAPVGQQPLAEKVSYFRGADPARWHTGIPTFRRVELPAVYPGIDVVFYGNQRHLEYDFIVAPGADPSRIEIAFDGASGLVVGKEGDLQISVGTSVLVQRAPVVFERRDGARRKVACHYRIVGKDRARLTLGARDPQAELLIDPILDYATYFGGGLGEEARGVAVDASGATYFTGSTFSSNLTVSPTALATSLAGSFDAFVTKLSPDGLTVLYSTYLGGSGEDQPRGLAVDPSGSAYVVGNTRSADFPMMTALDASYNGDAFFSLGDAFVSKLSPDGSSLAYSTYFGGTGDDIARAVAVDSMGNAIFSGSTTSADLPVKSAIKATIGAPGSLTTDAFAAKLGPNGDALGYATYLGGTNNADDNAFAAAVDPSGNAYIGGTTWSSDFPFTDGKAGAGASAAFVTKLAPGGSLVYGARLDGDNTETVRALAVDDKGRAHAAGDTKSMNFPVTAAAQQRQRAGTDFDCTTPTGCPDAFLTKLSPDGGSFEVSTYYGGLQSDIATGVAVAPSGAVHVIGTTSSVDLVIDNALQDKNGGKDDMFIARFSPQGYLADATYLGGSGLDAANGVAVDAAGSAHIVGATESTGFPAENALQASLAGNQDAVVLVVEYESKAAGGGPVLPSRGGDIGFVTLSVAGVGFAPDATFKLKKAGEKDILPIRSVVAPDGSATTGPVDLRNVAQGDWDVVVTSDGVDLVYAQAFTVEPGKPAEVWVQLLGRTTVRAGRDNQITVLYGNKGNVDAIAVPILVTGFPKDTTLSASAVLPIDKPLPSIDDAQWNALGPVHVTDHDARVAVTPAFIPPGTTSSFTITYNAKAPVDVTLRGSAHQPLVDEINDLPSPLAKGSRAACLGAIASEILNFFPAHECAEAVGKWLSTTIYADIPLLVYTGSHGHPPVLNIAQIMAGFAHFFADCVKSAVAQEVFQAIEVIIGGLDILEQCAGITPGEILTRIVASLDPNDKAGVCGGGELHAIRSEVPLAYQIFFENVESTSAPAAEVLVEDVLPPQIDISTIRLGPIKVANRTVTPPPDATAFSGDLDLTSTQQVIARVEGKVDVVTRKLTWKFTSIDPGTGLPPDDPVAGFLAPNKASPQGEGSVIFFARSASGVKTGATIDNKASIVFDTNPAIETPVWSNLIDDDPPMTAIVTKSGASSTPTFEVAWGGADPGSGIASYDVHVSVDGGAFQLWRSGVETSASYEGKLGSTYAFYVKASDFAGNDEQKPPAAEVTIDVRADSTTSGGGDTSSSENSCGCRIVGHPGGAGGVMLFGALLALAGARHHARSRRGRRTSPP